MLGNSSLSMSARWVGYLANSSSRVRGRGFMGLGCVVSLSRRLQRSTNRKIVNPQATKYLGVTQRANDQLTDGGPLMIPELPTGCAGPPFGEAPGSTVFLGSGPYVFAPFSPARSNRNIET